MNIVVRRCAIAAGAGLLSVVVGTSGAVVVVAAGQPNVECEDFSTRPGNAESAGGSAFNPDGIAGTVYAGEQPQNSRNTHSVAQYDVACEKVSARS
jgi:hypothetical protein